MLITVDGHMGGSFYYPLFLFICLKFSLTNSFKKKKKQSTLIQKLSLSSGQVQQVYWWTWQTTLPTCFFPLVRGGIVGIHPSPTYSSNITVWIWA